MLQYNWSKSCFYHSHWITFISFLPAYFILLYSLQFLGSYLLEAKLPYLEGTPASCQGQTPLQSGCWQTSCLP